MTLTITSRHLDLVFGYFDVLLFDIWETDWEIPLADAEQEEFLSRCQTAAVDSHLIGSARCPVCRAMRLPEIDPLVWPVRCGLCPLNDGCWQPPGSVYNAMLAALDTADPVVVFLAIYDAMAYVDGVRVAMIAAGGRAEITVADEEGA